MAKPIQPQFDPQKIYIAADEFHAANAYLRSTRDINTMNVLTMPTIILSAFASELYLKCLLCMETGNVPPQHHLKTLFCDLRPETKKRIEMLWDEHIPRMKNMWDQMEQHAGRPVPRTLAAALDEGGDAFRVLRYHYEKEKHHIAFVLGELPLMLRSVILEYMPAWRTDHHTPPTEHFR